MDEEKSTCNGTVCSEDSDQTDSCGITDVRRAEGLHPSISEGTIVNAEGKEILGQIGQETMPKIGAVLDDNNRKGMSNSLEDISIKLLPLQSSISLTNLCSANTKCSVKTQEDGLPDHRILSCNNSHASVSSKIEEAKCICSDEEDTVFNNAALLSYQSDFSEKSDTLKTDTHSPNQDTETSTESTELKSNMQLLEVVSKPDDTATNVVENEQVLCNMGEQKLSSLLNTRRKTYDSTRPTLADDSRLVKISLPANPIHLVQSNTQFLSKSRNFLNFITEKSTNIMEKALLPQQLALKYNSVLKTIDSTYGERKYTGVPSPNLNPSPMNLACSSNDTNEIKNISPTNAADLKTEVNDCQMMCTTDIKEKDTLEQLDNNTCTTDEEVKTHPPAVNNSYSTVLRDTLITTQDSGIAISTNLETNSVDKIENSNIVDKINGPNTCAEINGNTELSEWIMLNLKDNNINPKHDTNFEINTLNEEQSNTTFENSKQGLLQHPAYLALLKDYADLKANNLKLQGKVELLEERNCILEAEKSGEIFKVQIETLEKTVHKLTSELHTALTTQEVLKKEYNVANKERESMVMKYAVGEKQLIDTQRARDCAERKLKEVAKEQELLQNKLRQAQGERTRICTILDGKCREITELQKEVERLKEEMKMRDVKLKWTQNKLKTETDLQKETQQKLDKATARINEMKEECDQIRKEAQESMRKFQQSEENKAVTLDQQLKEQQARLILERHVTEDKEMLRQQLQNVVETLTRKQNALTEENNMLRLNIQELEKDRLKYENNFSSLKIVAEQRQKEIVDLQNTVSELETLKLDLEHKEQCFKTAETEMANLRIGNEELQSEMRMCRQKEGDLLDFTQKLTEKNVRLQSEFTEMESKMKQLEKEHGPLHERINELTAQVKSLEKSLSQEQKMRIEECEILARHLAEQTQLAQNLAQQLEDSQGENTVLKRKQQLSIKELTRELQQCRKRLEEFEAASPCNSLDITSRTGSNVSLNTGDTLNGALSDNSTNGDQSVEPSKQDMMMQRIIKLQKINVKRAEKIDFLEEHNRILVEELQKKTRIIQNYILHENFGAMGNNERDRHKAELARHGGIMASLYNQRVSDDNMTLELSLEINQKLQAVLEDVLLKNITLKSNIDTLGEEIARLTMQNQQRHIKN